MSYRFNWTYPNIKKFYSKTVPIRGSLKSRFSEALKLKLTRIEVPFDLVKKEYSEYEILGKEVGEIIDNNDFIHLYGGNNEIGGEYILHTDPEGLTGHHLYWNSPNWRKKYLTAMIDFSEFVNKASFGVEFHSGRSIRSREFFEDFIVEAIECFKNEYENEAPYILVENRRGHYISTADDMIRLYWAIHDRTSKSDIEMFGLCVDVGQLYTVTGAIVADEIEKIPRKAIKDWHIHYFKHIYPPSDEDPIDWQKIVELMKETHNSTCLPELHTEQNVEATIDYIEYTARRSNLRT